MTTLEFNKEYLTLVDALMEKVNEIKAIQDRVCELKEKVYPEIDKAYQRRVEAEDETKFTDDEYIERSDILNEWENYADNCTELAFDLNDTIKLLLKFRE